MKKIKVYIAGPVSMIQDYNRPAFEKAKSELIALGYDAISPSDVADELDKGEHVAHKWIDYMRECIKRLVDCDRIYLLDNWHASRGAKIEWNLARDLGIEPLYLEGDYEKFR